MSDRVIGQGVGCEAKLAVFGHSAAGMWYSLAHRGSKWKASPTCDKTWPWSLAINRDDATNVGK
ncbi:hypothetical protein BCR44DRAFT_83666 [Catenaria anguillulae PL171]|uniref:Uncharacterized protein n=1 Tax=Catenaria anguillulae PL171 TaxID=765915 RepID=A0A1Y2HU58_9FUNG|nr:hypothetical protein BCR44DRAFT_83666 [Catenaria anguillulae PL171]